MSDHEYAHCQRSKEINEEEKGVNQKEGKGRTSGIKYFRVQLPFSSRLIVATCRSAASGHLEGHFGLPGDSLDYSVYGA